MFRGFSRQCCNNRYSVAEIARVLGGAINVLKHSKQSWCHGESQQSSHMCSEAFWIRSDSFLLDLFRCNSSNLVVAIVAFRCDSAFRSLARKVILLKFDIHYNIHENTLNIH